MLTGASVSRAGSVEVVGVAVSKGGDGGETTPTEMSDAPPVEVGKGEADTQQVLKRSRSEGEVRLPVHLPKVLWIEQPDCPWGWKRPP